MATKTVTKKKGSNELKPVRKTREMIIADMPKDLRELRILILDSLDGKALQVEVSKRLEGAPKTAEQASTSHEAAIYNYNAKTLAHLATYGADVKFQRSTASAHKKQSEKVLAPRTLKDLEKRMKDALIACGTSLMDASWEYKAARKGKRYIVPEELKELMTSLLNKGEDIAPAKITNWSEFGSWYGASYKGVKSKKKYTLQELREEVAPANLARIEKIRQQNSDEF